MTSTFQFIPVSYLVALAAVFGALWGSFANVVIVRWPQGKSVVRPASHCPVCLAPIRAYDNIPILSYFILRGRCRDCETRFSPRYALVETILALLSVAVLRVTLLAHPPDTLFGLTEYFIWFAFMWALVTLAFIDLDTFLLPDAITLPGIAVGLAANIFVLKTGWLDPLLGALGGYALIALLFVHGYKLLTGAQGMGEGDPKLVAMIGAFLGTRGAMFALFAGAAQGLVIGSALVLRRRRRGEDAVPAMGDDGGDEGALESDPRFRKAKVPFGPFLALGAIEYYFFGDYLIGQYTDAVLNLLG